MSEVSVIEPGTKVYVDHDEEVVGKVVRVLLDEGKMVRYVVAYWSNGSRNECTIPRSSARAVERNGETRIGYDQPNVE